MNICSGLWFGTLGITWYQERGKKTPATFHTVNIQRYISQSIWNTALIVFIDRQMGQNAAATLRYHSTTYRPTWCMFWSTSSIMSGELCLSLNVDAKCSVCNHLRTLHCSHYVELPNESCFIGGGLVLFYNFILCDISIVSGPSGQRRSQILIFFKARCDPENFNYMPRCVERALQGHRDLFNDKRKAMCQWSNYGNYTFPRQINK